MALTNCVIRPETVADHDAIRHITRLSFGQAAEAVLIDALRDTGLVRLSLVAEAAGQVVGHILFSDVGINTQVGRISALALAPMAVRPEFQKRGIGSLLVEQGLDECRKRGHQIIIVLGYPDFYRRFGFSSELTASLESPFGGESFMAVELAPRALENVKGKVEYPPPFKSL